MVGAALALMLAMSWGGTRYALGVGADPRPARGLGSCCGLLFALRARDARRSRSFRLRCCASRSSAAITVAGFFSVGVMIGLSIFLPLYFELVLGFSPSGSGTALIVFLAGGDARLVRRRAADGAARRITSACRSSGWCSAS